MLGSKLALCKSPWIGQLLSPYELATTSKILTASQLGIPSRERALLLSNLGKLLVSLKVALGHGLGRPVTS